MIGSKGIIRRQGENSTIAKGKHCGARIVNRIIIMVFYHFSPDKLTHTHTHTQPAEEKGQTLMVGSPGLETKYWRERGGSSFLCDAAPTALNSSVNKYFEGLP